MNSDELGKEFWGIILFETHIVHLYQLLNIEKYKKSLFDFIDWIVFPDNIPIDSQKIFGTILHNRFRLAHYHQRLSYSNQVVELINISSSIRPFSQEEKYIQDAVSELLKLKYQNEYLEPSSFFILYELISYEYFSILLEIFSKRGFLDKYRAADYQIHFMTERGCTD